ncbi:LysR family transcriptional regulator [Rhodobium gokarnense]|uniref:DNA-binding transcriptional LysR family regulator n=1 Tax=Rhodobium gokarnense TaxID=364296 RepID=A0ABT3HDM2_9HYPH|nr:LysR family transcriptional regulator [Rhodobium gokarnense]MCW2308419.1 DNA-binding transcriptional LysR family regulator [Rhodobium gokarnense]
MPVRLSRSDLRFLQVFEAVARHGAFSAAEAELNISASTISNHMTALEERLGIKLCQRGRTGFRLTEKGAMVLDAARRLFKAIGDFDAEIGALKGTLTGELRIGLVDSMVTDPNSRMSEAVAAFGGRGGDVSITLMQDRPQELQQKVYDGVYHCGIGSFPHLISGLESVPLYDEQHYLYAATDHPVLAEDAVTPEALRRHAFIRRGYWRATDEKRLLLGPVEATVHQIEPQLMLILSGRYLGFLPEHYARQWVEDGRLRAILPDEVSYTCTFCLILRKGYRPTETLKTFLKDLRTAHGGAE